MTLFISPFFYKPRHSKKNERILTRNHKPAATTIHAKLPWGCSLVYLLSKRCESFSYLKFSHPASVAEIAVASNSNLG
ncbi:MAG: hypothetical protein BGO21_02245 [Dyadobacter sp. 50-39]|nr:MAG: hypothetical protein BGO21_02245 [Dyadobacter sp. 50-39]